MDRIPTLPVVLDSPPRAPLVSRREAMIMVISAGAGAGLNELLQLVRDRDTQEEDVAVREHRIEREKELAMRIHDARRVMYNIANGKLNHIVVNLRIRILQEWIEALEKDQVENRDILSGNYVLDGQLERMLEELGQAIDILKQRQQPAPLNREKQVT